MLSENDQILPAPPIELTAIPDVELKSDFMAYHRGQPLVLPDFYPSYVGQRYDPDQVNAYCVPAVDWTREFDEPVVFVSNWSMQTYGHFLLEVLPKILLYKTLRTAGMRAKLAFPSDAAYVSVIINQILQPDEIIFYQSTQETLRVPLAIFPSVPVSESFHLHSWYASAIWNFAAGIAHAERQKKLPGPRLFLSRQHVTGFRTLSNEAEVFSVASDYGFELVHPQELQWLEQVAMFFAATHVIGADNSALHAAMFCRPGTKIVSLGRVHNIQGAIASVFGHAIGYVMPSVGHLGAWTAGGSPQFYEVDATELRWRLDTLMRYSA